MTDLNLKSTQSTPSIYAVAGVGKLEMRGDSNPENSFEFFKPIVGWMENFLNSESTPFALELHLLYLNTSSVKAVMDIFDLLEEAHADGREVSVQWFYDQENSRIVELAEEFKEDCFFPFEIIGSDSSNLLLKLFVFEVICF